MNFFFLFFSFLISATPTNETLGTPTEYIPTALLNSYYPEASLRELPPQTRFQFSRTNNILIQPNARRTGLFNGGFLNCELVSEQNNTNLLRVSMPKVVSSVTVVPYNENRRCIESRIPIPEGLSSEDFEGHCEIQDSYIINMTGKCFEAVERHDDGNYYFTTKVISRGENPRLYTTAGLLERLQKACKKDSQTIEIDFEGELKMVCYDSVGVTRMSEFVRNLESAFGITIQVPAPSNLHDINFRRSVPEERPPVSI
jgi:hypothetical protein